MATSIKEGGFDLRSICDALGRVKTKWQKIGVQLGIPRHKLLEFKKEDDPLAAVVDYWLQGNVTESVLPISWQSIVRALKSEHVGEFGLAEEINKKYCQQDDTSVENAGDSTSPPPPAAKDPVSVKKDTDFVIKKNLKEIITKFGLYVECIRRELEERKVPPEDLRSFLLYLPASSNGNQKLILLEDFQQELEKYNTIKAIFNFLRTKYSFLNYDIYHSIAENYNINEDIPKMKYKEHIKDFVQKQTIEQFAKINPQLKTRPSCKELTLKFDIETTCSLAKITDLEVFIANILEVHPSALELVDINDGCVIVTFLIPASIANSIFTPELIFTPQQGDKLHEASILWLKCNGYTFHFGKTIVYTKNPAFTKLEQQLTCSVCLGRYTDPKLLQCHHTYCQKCLQGLVQQDQQGQLTLTCPTCRQVTPIPASGVAGLQADFRVNQFLEVMEEELKTSKNTTSSEQKSESSAHKSTPLSKIKTFCPQHDGRELELYCNTCEDTICLRCTIKGQKHNDHDYEELHQAVERKITASLAPMERQLETANEALAQLDSRCHEIYDRQAALKDYISKTIKELQDTLEIRKTELFNQLDEITQIKLKSLAAQRDQIETTQAQLSSCLFFMRENLKTGNQGELMKSTTVKRVEKLTRAFKPKNMEPSTQADMIFSALEDLCVECQNYGEIYVESDRPDPSNCYTKGKGITTATVGKKSTAILQTVSLNNHPCRPYKNTTVTCELVSERTGIRVEGSVERRGQSQYQISYQPTNRDRHQLYIKMEGQHIRGSPFPVSAWSPVEKVVGTFFPILSISEVNKPYGVAVNKKEEVIVAEWNGHCVTVFSPSGERLLSFGTHGSRLGQFNYPDGVVVDREENILVADTDNHRIQKFTARGEFLTAVGTEGTGPLQFHYPHGIAINNSSNRLYVVDSENHRIQILSPDFRYLAIFGNRGSGAGQFNFPQHAACDRTGNVYVADYANHRIQVFTAEGKFLRMFGMCGEDTGKLKEPWCVAIDSSDRVYVSEWGNDRVSVFTSKGQFVTSFGKWGKGQGQFYYPSGIAVDSSGVVYVCDKDNNRVQLF